MGLTKEQHDLRKSGIGGSDAGAVIGLNPYRTPFNVWLEKTGREPAPDLSDNAAVRWGNILEDVVAQEYASVTGRKLRKIKKTRYHKRYPFMLANIDRLVVGENGLLEIKTAGHFADGWGEPGTDQVPESYIAQCCHYLAVYDRDWCDLAVLIGGRDFRVYHINRDRKLEHYLIDAERRFWDLVVRDVPPEPSSLEDVAKRWPKDNGGTIETTPQITEDLTILKSWKKEVDQLKNLIELKELEIKKYIGDNLTLVDADGKPLATWKTQKTNRVNIKRLKEEEPDIAEKYTDETETRVFRIKNRSEK